jgi:hypothetical protein
MLDMPIRGRAVLGAVLAHRGDHDAVGQFDRAEMERREQMAWHRGNLSGNVGKPDRDRMAAVRDPND